MDKVAIENSPMKGVRVEVSDNRPADIAGVRDGDIVIAFNDVPIRTQPEFEARIRRAIPRSTVKLLIFRDGEKIEIPVVVGKR